MKIVKKKLNIEKQDNEKGKRNVTVKIRKYKTAKI